nr:ATP synthase F0 subunit 8 [Eocanthecona furcellata]
MPQMAPLWWEILFIVFIMTFLTFSIMIYFNKKNSTMSKTLSSKSIKNLNWMW